jgi:hypothetical protein
LSHTIVGSEEKQLQEAALATSARLKQALVKERESKTALQNMTAELQVYITIFQRQLSRCVITITLVFFSVSSLLLLSVV